MLAEVIDFIRPASLPILYAPNDSPRSELISMRMRYLVCSVVLLSLSAGGFGGLGRLMLKLAPPQNGSTFRSISWRPVTRYSSTALSHCRPAVATSFIQSPRAVSSGASVLPSQIVTFGCRVMKSWLCGFARAPLIDL